VSEGYLWHLGRSMAPYHLVVAPTYKLSVSGAEIRMERVKNPASRSGVVSRREKIRWTRANRSGEQAESAAYKSHFTHIDYFYNTFPILHSAFLSSLPAVGYCVQRSTGISVTRGAILKIRPCMGDTLHGWERIWRG